MVLEDITLRIHSTAFSHRGTYYFIDITKVSYQFNLDLFIVLKFNYSDAYRLQERELSESHFAISIKQKINGDGSVAIIPFTIAFFIA